MPERYWRPTLGHWFSLRPADLGDLTPEQLVACMQFIEKQRREG